MKKVMPIDWFRGIAIMFVVSSHVPLTFVENGGYWSEMIGAVVKNGTFFFVFISGFLFQWLKHKYEVKKYFNSKLKYVVTPYIIVLTSVLVGVYVLDKMEIIDYDGLINWNSPFSKDGYFWHLYVGGAAIDALWYIPMAVCFFIAAPFFLFVSDSKWFVTVTVILLFANFTTFRPPGNIDPLYSFIHYIGVYMFGMLLAKYFSFFSRHTLAITVYGALGTVICLVIHRMQVNSEYAWFYKGEFNFNLIEIQKAHMTLLIFGVLLMIDRYVKSIKTLEFLASISFGVFFVHGVIIWILRKVDLFHGWNAWIEYVCFYLLVLGISVGIISLVKLVFGKRSRLIVGS
ncbi:hypothetical protein TDB9533_02308 [Thalassocella blandensis]|nr:hypothetical protein TDB9533_02308 [Thalassocella blandensis]